ncbi:MAG: spheroidene monooxygenase [Pararhodobacter sp.]
MQHVALSLFRFDRLATRLWVITQMALSRPALGRLPGLSFYKLCGSGTGEGFTPRPDFSVWAILTTWDSEAQAREALSTAKVFRRWRAKAAESWTVHLQPSSARGQWAGVAPFLPESGASTGPLAALTRATLRPSRLLRFWARVPDISLGVARNKDVLFKIGIGEIPLLHQVTFSIWPDAERMNAFARTGAHAAAIRAVRDEGWFAEELYARFRVTGSDGTWHERNPLAPTPEAAL